MAAGLDHAGQFTIEKLDLITSSGLRVDLITTVMGITLFEDIHSMTITGTVAIQDSVNLASIGPLIGQEYLHLKIRTPFKDENEDISIHSLQGKASEATQKATSQLTKLQWYVLAISLCGRRASQSGNSDCR